MCINSDKMLKSKIKFVQQRTTIEWRYLLTRAKKKKNKTKRYVLLHSCGTWSNAVVTHLAASHDGQSVKQLQYKCILKLWHSKHTHTPKVQNSRRTQGFKCQWLSQTMACGRYHGIYDDATTDTYWLASVCLAIQPPTTNSYRHFP